MEGSHISVKSFPWHPLVLRRKIRGREKRSINGRAACFPTGLGAPPGQGPCHVHLVSSALGTMFVNKMVKEGKATAFGAP